MPRKNPIQRLREICLELPEASEQVFGGHTTATFRVLRMTTPNGCPGLSAHDGPDLGLDQRAWTPADAGSRRLCRCS
jgi:hypothetical protein